MVVMRALAKDPSERYQSAEEMDADLRRDQPRRRDLPVTEEAATAIISRPPADVTAITSHAPRPPAPYAPPAAYYDYDEPPRRAVSGPGSSRCCSSTAALVGGYFLYSQIQDQLSGSKTVAVGNYTGLREIAAGPADPPDAGLRPNPVRQPNADPSVSRDVRLLSRHPRPETDIQKNNFVTIYVSSRAAEDDGSERRRASSSLERCRTLQDAKLKGRTGHGRLGQAARAR